MILLLQYDNVTDEYNDKLSWIYNFIQNLRLLLELFIKVALKTWNTWLSSL